MSKKLETIKKIERVGEFIPALSKDFVYEVSIYKLTENSYNLEDTKDIISKKYVLNSDSHFVKDGIKFYKKIELIKAPKDHTLKK